jgi:hypothetical protein
MPDPLSRLVRFVKAAGAPTEKSTDRSGFASYHAESHAIGGGIGFGFIIGAASMWSVAGVLLNLVLYGRRGETALDPKFAKDLIQEPHYFVASLVLGALLGLGVRAVTL